jgi:hypothetical protein
MCAQKESLGGFGKSGRYRKRKGGIGVGLPLEGDGGAADHLEQQSRNQRGSAETLGGRETADCADDRG